MLAELVQRSSIEEVEEAEESTPRELELKELTRAESWAEVEVFEQLSQLRICLPVIVVFTLYLMRSLN